MKCMVTLDGNISEIKKLKTAVSDVVAGLTDEYWDTKFFSALEESREYLKSEPLVDFACWDVTLKGVTSMLPEFRRAYEEMGLLLIAYSPETLNDTLKDFIREGLDRTERNTGEDSFVMETKEGKTYFPYDNIYYFESREKKIFIRLLNEEYGFYSTMDELEKLLPERFIRCHRSYIVNSEKIRRVLMSQNLIELVKDFVVPLSRTYKQMLKGI